MKKISPMYSFVNPPVPPHNEELERAALAAMLDEIAPCRIGTEILTPEDFYVSAHRGLFHLFCEMGIASAFDLDLALVDAEVNKRRLSLGTLGTVGRLLETLHSPAQIESYAKELRGLSRRRYLLEKATELWERAQNPSFGDPEEFLTTFMAPTGQPGRNGNSAAGQCLYRRFADIEAKPIPWLWPQRIARGTCSLIVGNPGLGKSQITASLAAVVSTGGNWPVDRTPCQAGNVIFLSAEDVAEFTARPRLEAAGCNLDRIFTLDAVRVSQSGGGQTQRAFSLQLDIPRLEELLRQIGDVALVVIDPISAYLGDVDSHVNAEVRGLLTPLSELAARHNAAIVGISHLNKAAGAETLLRVSGSLAFIAAARSAYLVCRDREDDSRRLFLPLKNNLGPDTGGLAYQLEPLDLDTPAGQIGTCRIFWHADPVNITADQAMQQPNGGSQPSALEVAEDFLSGQLGRGPAPAAGIQAAAEEIGIAPRTLRRAKASLKITQVKDGLRGGWLWSLPEERANAGPEGGQQ